MLRLRCLSSFLLAIVLQAQPFSSSLYDRLEWRNIGPFRAGRVIAVAGVPGDVATYYFGAVGGGVWKTTNAGTTWKPIFDGEPIASIGAITVAPSDPRIIYVGSGEADMRSQIGFGDGVYKSTDAGRNWKNVGLRDTRQIAKIIVDPRDPNLVFVAALGHAYGPNPERGVFRSTDGGEHWQKVLDRGPETGAADLAIDPGNSRLLLACMWNARRPVWSQYPPLYGPGSGLFRSTDGGTTWSQIKSHGLPEGEWHRSGVAVAAGGRVVYALVDAPPSSGLYRSDDGGENWLNVSSDKRITERSWYFSNVTVDPKNPDVVYVPNVALFRSTDGGKSFTAFKGAPGGDDYHILWIDPADSRRMLLGSDQGTNISFDGGGAWSTWYNQPTAQMYHVATDRQFPYVVYGAQQDSGTIAVRSRTDHGEIDGRDWFAVGGEESGYIVPDPQDPHILYVGDTYGTLNRFDTRIGQSQNITPWPAPFDSTDAVSTRKYRFPWTAPLAVSPLEPGTLYYGAQMLLKTTDGGLHWQAISPDLTGDTRKDPSLAGGAPTTANARSLGYGVIYAVAPSPKQAGVIWAGTDTGLMHLTQDGGKTWRDVTPKGVSDWSRVTHIEASRFDAAVAYVSVDRHRLEDYRPYIYRTADSGKTWSLITEGLSEPAYVHSVAEDPHRQGLLYASTEMGVDVSFDDGGHWQSLGLNLPVCPVRDLEVHDDDLVIATFGRGFWILDNASLLREITPGVAFSEAHLYKPADAVRLNPDAFPGTPVPFEEPQAKNPPAGAALDFYLRSAPEGEVAIEILDPNGALIRRYSSRDPLPQPAPPGAIAAAWIAAREHLTPRAGMNRLIWDLRYPLPGGKAEIADNDGGPPLLGPLARPGVYEVRLLVDGRQYTHLLKVVADPRTAATTDDFARQFELSSTILQAMARADQATAEIAAFRKQLDGHRVRAQMAGKGPIVGLIVAFDAEANRAAKSVDAQNEHLQTALGVVESGDRTPPAVAYQMCDEADQAISQALEKWQVWRKSRIAEINKQLQAAGLESIR